MMKKDDLEKFVLENQQDFDVYEPAPEVWDKIWVETQKKKSAPLWIKVSRYAAVVAVSVLFTFLAGKYFSQPEQKAQQTIASTNEKPKEEIIIPEIAEAEAYYSSQVDSKINEISILTTNNPDVKMELDYDLKELEQIYFELKKDLADNAGNQEVIEAMIQNYRTRVEILESLLKSLKNENKTRENHENNSVSL